METSLLLWYDIRSGGGTMIQVILDDKIVFEGTETEAEEFCNNNEWDYTQDTSYAEFEKACGIYC